MSERDQRALEAFMARQYERSPEEVAREARALVKDPQRGPLEGPYGPSGWGGVAATASGRSPEEAASEGPVPAPGRPGGGSASSPGASSSGRNAELGGTRVGMTGMTPEVLEEAARLLRVQRETQGRSQAGQAPPSDGEVTEHEGPPRGYRPPGDETRQEQADPEHARKALGRLLLEAPDLVREALPNSRARSMVLQHMDGARLWFQEAERLDFLERLQQAE